MRRKRPEKNGYSRQQFKDIPLGPRGCTVTAYERGTSGKAYRCLSHLARVWRTFRRLPSESRGSGMQDARPEGQKCAG